MKENVIDEMIGDIRSAEERADRLVHEAAQRGKDILMTAQAEADRIRRETAADCKELSRHAESEAERIASERRAATLRKGEAAANKLLEDKNSAVEVAADKVVEMLLKEY